MGPYNEDNMNTDRAENPMALTPMLRSLSEDLTLIKDVLASLQKHLGPLIVKREDEVKYASEEMLVAKQSESNPGMSDLSLKVNSMQVQARDIRRQISNLVDQVSI